MKIYLILCSLTLASCALLDGYQYKQNQQGFIGNSLIGSGGGGGGSGSANHHQHQLQQGFIGIPSPSITNQFNSGQQGLIAPPQTSYGVPHQSSSVQGTAINQRPSFQGGPVGPVQNFQGGQQVQNVAPIVTKDVYIHVAPEEPEEQNFQQNQQQQAAPRKHYRIIFIKTPSQSSRSAAFKLAQAQQQIEEKTVIYVLSKKTDAADIQAALQQAPQPVQHKPEVFFIKYKTQQEALHAQQQIQAQYDALGGSSQISDEGIAPISSVIGSLGGNQGGSSSSSSGHFAGGHHGGNGGGISISGTASSGQGGSFTSQQNSGYLPPHRH